MTEEMGHNGGPELDDLTDLDPLEVISAEYGEIISEAENWLDGQKVDCESQMRAVDAINKEIKAAKKTAVDAQKAESAPLHKVWKDSIAKYKPTIDDLDKISKGLTALVGGYKKELADAKAHAEREAWKVANEARTKAEMAAQVDASNIESVREAEELKKAAIDAEKAAQAAKRSTKDVKGLRKATKYSVDDERALLHWIAKNDKPALRAFVHSWAKDNHKTCGHAEGLSVWEEKEAF